ncbi:MAG: ion channel [Geminicoccaceae bacterium]
MLTTILIGALIGIATVLLHHRGLSLIGRYIATREVRGHGLILIAIFGVFGLHLIEIGCYAAAYYLATELLDLGRLVGDVAGTDLEILFFAAETYTSLGFGDIIPQGPLRLLASFEPLNGLILLGWSASFIYVEMQKLDAVDRRRGRRP